MFSRVLLTGVMIMSIASAPFGTSLPEREILFPRVEGSNLEGRDFDLPADFEGDLNLVVIAFQREQHAVVDTWVPVLRRLAEREPSFRYYELPTIYRANAMVRWFIDSGMRRGISDVKARESTITLYLDKGQFRSELDIPHEDTIYVMLLGANGEVIWRTEGAMTDTSARELEALVSERLSG